MLNIRYFILFIIYIFAAISIKILNNFFCVIESYDFLIGFFSLPISYYFAVGLNIVNTKYKDFLIFISALIIVQVIIKDELFMQKDNICGILLGYLICNITFIKGLKKWFEKKDE